MTHIYFDLDGTLLDASERLYRLFCDLVPDCTFSKNQYWELKRNKINHKQILKTYFPTYDFITFNNQWMQLIEDKKYLALDKLYPFTIPLLASLKRPVFLLTARQSKFNLEEELNSLGIKSYFNQIFVTQQQYSKLQLLQSLALNPSDIFISDMGKDIQTAKQAGIKSIGVSWGFMSSEKLSNYQPDFLCTNIDNLYKIMEKNRI